MRQMWKLWNDDRGVTETIEWLFWVTIVVIGLVTGMVAVRQAIKTELIETANAILALNQSFSFAGESNCKSATPGSAATETTQTIHNGDTFATPNVITQGVCD
jgi:hypothetical protein